MLIPKRILEARSYAFLGGLIFWVPDIVLHWLSGNLFSGWDVLILTLSLPLITCSVLVLHWRRSLERESHAPEAFAALVGIWLFGPAMMSLGWVFTSAPPHRLLFVVGCSVLFPVCTPMMSTYDGTLFAVLITTALLPLLSISGVGQRRSGDRA